MVKAIIFDIGGVLVENSNVPVLQQLADKYQLEFTAVQEVIFFYSQQLALGEITETEILDEVAKKFGLPETGAELYKTVTDIYRPIEEVWEYVRQLTGKYQLAILSNMGLDGVATHEQEYQISKYFAPVFYSANWKMKKPNPEFYQKLVEEMGVEVKECIFIDDMPRNVDVAKGLGMQGIVYLNPEQLKTELVAAGVEF